MRVHHAARSPRGARRVDDRRRCLGATPWPLASTPVSSMSSRASTRRSAAGQVAAPRRGGARRTGSPRRPRRPGRAAAPAAATSDPAPRRAAPPETTPSIATMACASTPAKMPTAPEADGPPSGSRPRPARSRPRARDRSASARAPGRRRDRDGGRRRRGGARARRPLRAASRRVPTRRVGCRQRARISCWSAGSCSSARPSSEPSTTLASLPPACDGQQDRLGIS